MIPFLPSSWKLIAAGVAVVGLLGVLGAVGAAIDKHGYDKAAAVYQPKLDKANQDIGTLTAANTTDEATIAALKADAASNAALITDYEQQIDDLNQQADDAAAAIRKVQQNDPTVDAYLRTPIPAALRSVLMGPGKAGDAARPANQAGHAAAAKAGAVPAIRP